MPRNMVSAGNFCSYQYKPGSFFFFFFFLMIQSLRDLLIFSWKTLKIDYHSRRVHHNFIITSFPSPSNSLHYCTSKPACLLRSASSRLKPKPEHYKPEVFPGDSLKHDRSPILLIQENIYFPLQLFVKGFSCV